MCGRNNPAGSPQKRGTGIAQGCRGTEGGKGTGINQSEMDILARPCLQCLIRHQVLANVPVWSSLPSLKLDICNRLLVGVLRSS